MVNFRCGKKAVTVEKYLLCDMERYFFGRKKNWIGGAHNLHLIFIRKDVVGVEAIFFDALEGLVHNFVNISRDKLQHVAPEYYVM
jgi:hypothetical protein